MKRKQKLAAAATASTVMASAIVGSLVSGAFAGNGNAHQEAVSLRPAAWAAGEENVFSPAGAFVIREDPPSVKRITVPIAAIAVAKEAAGATAALTEPSRPESVRTVADEGLAPHTGTAAGQVADPPPGDPPPSDPPPTDPPPTDPPPTDPPPTDPPPTDPPPTDPPPTDPPATDPPPTEPPSEPQPGVPAEDEDDDATDEDDDESDEDEDEDEDDSDEDDSDADDDDSDEEDEDVTPAPTS